MTAIDARPERLYLMPVGWSTRETPNGPLAMVVGCYLVRMSDGRNVLIDSGLPPDMGASPAGSPRADERNVIDHLAALDLGPDDIDTVIATHFDIDHVGYHDAFPNAEFVVQRAHRDLARSGEPRYAAGRPHWDHPALRYREVEGDVDALPGVTLIETSGHTPSHQSVLVRLPRTGPALLAIDAVPLARLFTEDRPATAMDADEAGTLASTRKLIDLAEREQAALVVFGHDGAQWKTLKLAPDYYD
ncbi:MAG TPA: N-acyl homoserine lactonase family protein [Thermomicrobiales bacterium]|nr:N-acyl homoserine lactonase family protein [Thermomicrobiales bacterium]